MNMNFQPSKFTIGAPLSAIAVSAMLLMGSVTGADAYHRGKAHVLGGVLGGAAVGALLGGAIKGKKGVGAGAAIGAVVGGAAAASSRPPPPRRPAYAAPAPPPTYYATPSRAYAGNLVYDIQTSLMRLQYNPGPIDGVFGRRTADAIGQYEFNSELPVTGQPSEALRYRLRQQAGG